MAKQGKYAHVLPQLKKEPLVKPERWHLVEAVKKEVLNPSGPPDLMPIDGFTEQMDFIMLKLLDAAKREIGPNQYSAEFARVYAELRGAKDVVDRWLSSLNLLIEAYMVLMVERFEVEGIKGLRLENGQPVSTHPEPYAKVTDPKAFLEWCLANDDLKAKLTLHWQTINAIAKERLLAGEEDPPGVETTSLTKIRLGSE